MASWRNFLISESEIRQENLLANCTSVFKEKQQPDDSLILTTDQIDNFLITLPQPVAFPAGVWYCVLLQKE